MVKSRFDEKLLHPPKLKLSHTQTPFKSNPNTNFEKRAKSLTRRSLGLLFTNYCHAYIKINTINKLK